MTIYPHAVRSLAVTSPRWAGRGALPKRWPLDITGDFCFYPDRATSSNVSVHADHLGSRASQLLALYCRATCHSHNVVRVAVVLTEREKLRILKETYVKETQRGAPREL